eukprot:TRINITY_DN50084_c0_g1_i1.p1 TRINITY_DN50084_c0_g1~~TRINITY_DN50084_c0_g1_i1.p1  ORF type:complete len:171 (+),score=30.96 TRINITY_DN50084_c0_g1_i1:90-602(+)
MSSIQEAVALDIFKNRGPSRFNPVVQNSGQQRTDGNIYVEADMRRLQERQERRMIRMAEGGRGGGYNDRQEPGSRQNESAVQDADEGELDDFGRRKIRRGQTTSKSERAQAALQRLRDRSNVAAAGKRREGSRGRSRSTSRGRRARSRSTSRGRSRSREGGGGGSGRGRP